MGEDCRLATLAFLLTILLLHILPMHPGCGVSLAGGTADSAAVLDAYSFGRGGRANISPVSTHIKARALVGLKVLASGLGESS